MVLRTQSTYGSDVESEPLIEVIRQSTETKTYVTDLLSELHTIARIGGLEALSADIEALVSRHLSKSGDI